MGDLVALLLVTLSGLIGPEVTEAQLEQKLAAVIMEEQPAPLRKVSADATGVSATGVKKIAFYFNDLEMDDLSIGAATFTVSDVRRQANGKLSIGGINWNGKITGDALGAALRAEGGNMKSAQVSVSPEGLTLDGKWPLALGAKVGYSVTGNLTVEQDTWLMFHIVRSDVSGVGVPGGINNMIEKEVNPVYDLAKFHARSEKEIELAREKLNYDFHLLVKKIEPKDGHIIVSGSA